MKLFTCAQISQIDRLTTELEPINSINLMERAATQIAVWMMQNLDNNFQFWFFAGRGNNGGDALAVARILAEKNLSCTVFLATFGHRLKGDAEINFSKLVKQQKVPIYKIEDEPELPEIPSGTVIVDGLFGSGLNKPLIGLAEKIVNKINHAEAQIISIDIPSGLFGEDNSLNQGAIVRADITLTFQFPKISFFFAENYSYTGKWEVLPIGLHPEAISQTGSNYLYLTKELLSGILKKRSKFSHKGTFGHALLIAGSYGKMGAAILSSRACLRSGVGLLTTHLPKSGVEIIQTSVPECMVSADDSETLCSKLPDLNLFSAIGIGPGLGTKTETREALLTLINSQKPQLVIDADALNLLAENQELIKNLPPNTILTPHPKEFERLAGASENSFQRLQKQIQFSAKYGVIIIGKGAYTCVTFPDGRVFFNSTGNPGMATAGSGDVLTGIILGLLAQHYSPEESALLGVFLHGLAGDFAAEQFGQHAMISGDIIDQLGNAFNYLE